MAPNQRCVRGWLLVGQSSAGLWREELVMTRFTEWLEAREHAIAKAQQSGLDVAIRRVKEFGKVGYSVSFASKNDSDYARAEIVKPHDQI